MQLRTVASSVLFYFLLRVRLRFMVLVLYFCFHSPIPNMRPRVHGNQGHEHLCSSNTGEIISREYGAGIYLISVFVTI